MSELMMYVIAFPVTLVLTMAGFLFWYHLYEKPLRPRVGNCKVCGTWSTRMVSGVCPVCQKPDEALMRRALEALRLSRPVQCGQADELYEQECADHLAVVQALRERLK